MAKMTAAQQFGASLTGNVESAYIIVYDFRKAENSAELPSAPDFIADSSGKINATTDDYKAEFQNKLKIKNAMDVFHQNVASTGADNLLNSSSSLRSAGTDKGASKIFRLQFNPSQFQVYASALPVNEIDTQGNSNVVNAVQAPGLTLSMSFWFDQATNWDCFPGDKFNGGLAPTNLAKNITSAVKKKSAEPTVQETVEAFLTALRDPYTRMVSFRWGDFVFTGELLSVGANYTMFSPEGAPVRAQMAIRIQQKQDVKLLSSWYQCFDDVIACGDTNYSLTRQKLGSAFNISR